MPQLVVLLAYASALTVGIGIEYAHALENTNTNNVVDSALTARSSLIKSPPRSPPSPPPLPPPHTWTPGAVLEGYELVERTALLGVCNYLRPTPKHRRKRLTGGAQATDTSKSTAVVPRDEAREVAVVEVGIDKERGFPIVARTVKEREEQAEDEGRAIVPEGPTLEYQCVLEDEIELIYVNSNYRLKKKFAAGSHGEVWRATRRVDTQHSETFILKRLFVERGELMVEMGMREAYFGKLLAHEAHVTRFVEYFFQTETNDASQSRHPFTRTMGRLPSQKTVTPSPHELWLVFYDEGISLRHYLYASRDSAHAAVLFEPSPFWHQLRVNAQGENVLREILRQLLEGVAALHDRGITHRDIKPSNILVHLESHTDENPNGLRIPIVKLADFGSAVDDHTFRHLYGEHGPTQAEETREYQAPEVLFSEFGAPYDFANPLAYDLWSVGVVFLEMVLGSPQVFMISPRARAKLDPKLRGKDEATRLKSYLLYVLTHEFCIYQPPSYELQTLWTQHALVMSDSCHFGRFNTTIVERDPMRTGLRNPWGLDLMWKLLQWNPSQRISARAALDHAFFEGPYVCSETGRQFATRDELRTHEAYLAIQRAREQEMAFVVREKYELPPVYSCPHCHRNFSTIASCEQHVVARRHHGTTGTHFCNHEKEMMRSAVRHDTLKHTNGFLVHPGMGVHVGVALLQGKKKYMEDFVVVDHIEHLNVSLYAVIDGHLGTGAADYVRTHLVGTVTSRLELYSQSKLLDENSVLERMLLRQVFLELHEGFLASRVDDSHDFSGCTMTLVVVFRDEGRVWSANVGDSRAILITGQDIYPLSMDHWPNNEHERQRIESSGGFVAFQGLWRVVGQLAVSRSIGDRHLRQFVTAEPSIFTLDLHVVAKDGGMLVIASDGVWDTMENRDVAQFLTDSRQDQSVHDTAADLVQEAFLRGSLDNLALVLIDLRPTT